MFAWWVVLHILIKASLFLQCCNLFHYCMSACVCYLHILHKLSVIILPFNLLHCQIIQMLRMFLIQLLFFIRKVFIHFHNLIIHRCLSGILPEIISKPAVIIMPGLCCQMIMDNVNILRIHLLTGHYSKIPCIIHIIYFILTDNIKIVLILGNYKCICSGKFHKALNNFMLPELLKINYNNSCVKISCPVNIKNLFCILTIQFH